MLMFSVGLEFEICEERTPILQDSVCTCTTIVIAGKWKVCISVSVMNILVLNLYEFAAFIDGKVKHT